MLYPYRKNEYSEVENKEFATFLSYSVRSNGAWIISPHSSIVTDIGPTDSGGIRFNASR